MSKVHQLKSILEDEPTDIATPEAGGKPNTNFPDRPEVDKAIKKVADELIHKFEDMLNMEVHDAMDKDPTLKALMDKEGDDEMMAHEEIRSMIIKMLMNG